MNSRWWVALGLCWSIALCSRSASGQRTSGPAYDGGSNGRTLPEAPGTKEPSAEESGGVSRVPQSRPTGVRPFSAVAIGVRVGLSGVGLELATPLARRLNLRAGGSFLSVDPHFVEDGIDVIGDIQLRSAFAAVDLFPFGGRFHISPGFTLYNGNRLNAKAMVPGGQEFDLGDGTYTSDTADPVHGMFGLDFGRKSAPRLTLGWGNMIPRTGGHWSFPFEIGAEYIGKPPQVTLTLAGTVCQGPGFCQPIDQNPTAQQNVTIEQNQINSDIPSWLRFFPLVSTGVSYRFGHASATTR